MFPGFHSACLLLLSAAHAQDSEWRAPGTELPAVQRAFGPTGSWYAFEQDAIAVPPEIRGIVDDANHHIRDAARIAGLHWAEKERDSRVDQHIHQAIKLWIQARALLDPEVAAEAYEHLGQIVQNNRRQLGRSHRDLNLRSWNYSHRLLSPAEDEPSLEVRVRNAQHRMKTCESLEAQQRAEASLVFDEALEAFDDAGALDDTDLERRLAHQIAGLAGCSAFVP